MDGLDQDQPKHPETPRHVAPPLQEIGGPGFESPDQVALVANDRKLLLQVLARDARSGD